MTETLDTETRSQFNSLNGGIGMWIPLFADYLAEYGLAGFFQEIREMSANTQDNRLKDDLLFLSIGVKSLDPTVLENSLVPVRGLLLRMHNLSEVYQQCAEALKQGERDWYGAAERAKQQLEVWEKWAYETEVAFYEKNVPWLDLNSKKFSLKLELCVADIALKSPKKLEEDLEFFNKTIAAIRKIICTAYCDDNLPINLAVSDFNVAIENLMEHQAKVNKLLMAESRARKEFEEARANSSSQKSGLLELLWSMDKAALWALFRISRPDLREPAGIKQSS
jgi:hypothetical protein